MKNTSLILFYILFLFSFCEIAKAIPSDRSPTTRLQSQIYSLQDSNLYQQNDINNIKALIGRDQCISDSIENSENNLCYSFALGAPSTTEEGDQLCGPDAQMATGMFTGNLINDKLIELNVRALFYKMCPSSVCPENDPNCFPSVLQHQEQTNAVSDISSETDCFIIGQIINQQNTDDYVLCVSPKLTGIYQLVYSLLNNNNNLSN